MINFLIFLSLGIAALLQTTIVPRIRLLSGTADLVFLALLIWLLDDRIEGKWWWVVVAGGMVGAASHIPVWLTVAGFALVNLFIYALQARIWQAPWLILFAASVAGTIIVNGLDLAYIWALGANVTFSEGFNLVILPSVILNAILTLPMQAIIGEFAKIALPVEVDV